MVKFAIQIENQFGYSWDQIKDIVQKTEKHGYHSFYICDHFFLDEDSVNKDALEAWTVLTAVSQITDKIKLGTLVSGNNYRNPALLAKIATSLDHVSNGRMEFGIGAGWKEVEYKAYGFTFPSVKERMDMLEESLQIIRALWTEDKATFQGEHFQVKDAVFSPKPVQDLPMILIGGGGEKRTLRMVAKYGDYMNLPFTPMDQIQQKLEALKQHCEDIGRDYGEIGKSYFIPMRVYETQEEVETAIKETAERSGRTEEEIRDRFVDSYPGSWMGTPDQLKERIDYMIEKGFDYFFIQMPFDLSSDLIERFANLVKDKYYT